MLKALAIRSAALVGALFVSVPALADDAGAEIPSAWHEEGLPILRFQKDPARERGWLLTRSGVFVFDFRTRQTTAHVALPHWVWAGEAFSCPPDLALGPKGEAVVSSNMEPTLWRIDPVTLAVTRHPLVLDAHENKDVGFTGVAYSAKQNTFYAASPFGALWRIDPLLRRAQHIEMSAPVSGGCSVTIATAGKPVSWFTRLCVRGSTVNVAPDGRSAHVMAQPCQ
jgi:hypothetical protein